MAVDSTVDKHAHGHDQHGHEDAATLWDGGHSPFKAPYGKLMMWYFLLSDAFTFAGFLIAYGALRFSMPAWPLPDFVFRTAPFCGDTVLPLVFVTFMTFVLLFSSYTMVRGVQEGHRENKAGVVKWMLLTIVGGLIFVGSQGWEWTNLIAKENMSIYHNPFSRHTEAGVYLTAEESAINKNADEHSHGHTFAGTKFQEEDPYLIAYNAEDPLTAATSGYYLREYHPLKEDGSPDMSVVKTQAKGPRSFGALFFFITGFHGFHVFSGVVFLAIVLMNVMSGIYGARHNGYETVEKIGLYWHFVDLVWVFVFLVFYLL